MAVDTKTHVTDIITGLSEPASGSKAAARELFSLLYDELRNIARRYMQRERHDHTLEPTALVHEAYFRLVDLSRIDWQGRTHFFGAAAGAMRRILIDHARDRGRLKRGGDWNRVTLPHALTEVHRAGLNADELLQLDAALLKLERLDSRQARIVELRFFAGLGVTEVAEALSVSTRTVESDWTHARVWLRRELAS